MVTPAPLQHFYLRLNPPRPGFPADITDAEKDLMRRHAAYWKELVGHGTVIVFGPVMDPKGTFGMGVMEAADEAALRALIAQDPSVLGGLNAPTQFEIHPMRVGGMRG